MLKLYKRTIIFCTTIMGITFAISLLLELFAANILHVQYIINCLLGVACSSFVVIITVYLQYSAEHKNIKKVILAQLREIFFWICCSLPDINGSELNSRQYDYVFEELSKHFESIHISLNEFCCFSTFEKRCFDDVYKGIGYLWIAFEKSRYDSHKEAIRNLWNCKALNYAVTSAICFCENSFDKDALIQSKQEIENYLSGKSFDQKEK